MDSDFWQILQELPLDAAGRALLLQSALIVLALLFLRWLVLWFIFRETEDVRVRYRSSKLVTYIAVALGVFGLVYIWEPLFASRLGTFLGLIGAGVAIALRDPIANGAGWLYILWRKPFELGDRIEVGGHAGDVVDLRLFRFSVLEIGNWVHADQSTGRLIHIPNSLVFTQSVANYTQEFQYIWNEIPVLITFESNWRKAKGLLQEIVDERCTGIAEEVRLSLKQAARSALILYSTVTPRVWTSVVDSGVLLTIRYLCNPRQRRGSTEMIWEDVLAAFAASEDIHLAYPTRRVVFPAAGQSGEVVLRPGKEIPSPPEG